MMTMMMMIVRKLIDLHMLDWPGRDTQEDEEDVNRKMM